MTEQKMIDGIDVSGCQYYEKCVCSCIDVRNCEGYIDLVITDCADNPNCYYKQLQRKTAELEETQKELQNFRQTNSFACKLAKNYEAVTVDFREHKVIYSCDECHHGIIALYGD